MLVHRSEDLIQIFNQCFAKDYNTYLVKGDDEPLYMPAGADRPSSYIYFAHGFFSSALHEVAHWLIAGEARRKEVDYGYWYVPDGRNAEEQALFQKVEVKPQALEWLLSAAANYPFQFSLDNLNGAAMDTDAFKQAVFEQARVYHREGLSERAAKFRTELAVFYGTDIIKPIQWN